MSTFPSDKALQLLTRFAVEVRFDSATPIELQRELSLYTSECDIRVILADAGLSVVEKAADCLGKGLLLLSVAMIRPTSPLVATVKAELLTDVSLPGMREPVLACVWRLSSLGTYHPFTGWEDISRAIVGLGRQFAEDKRRVS